MRTRGAERPAIYSAAASVAYSSFFFSSSCYVFLSCVLDILDFIMLDFTFKRKRSEAETSALSLRRCSSRFATPKG